MTTTTTQCPIVPVNQRLVVIRDAAETTTESGLVLPDNVKDQKLSKGTVLATSKDGGERETPATTGTRIFFSAYAGEDIEVNGETFTLVRWDEVIAYERNN
jgi:chaperonin GroES